MGKQNILSDLTRQRHKDGAYVFSRKPVSGLLAPALFARKSIPTKRC
jgi:hypothetical protein